MAGLRPAAYHGRRHFLTNPRLKRNLIIPSKQIDTKLWQMVKRHYQTARFA
jgi:hypothetical protein